MTKSQRPTPSRQRACKSVTGVGRRAPNAKTQAESNTSALRRWVSPLGFWSFVIDWVLGLGHWSFLSSLSSKRLAGN
jgi:hypothetical protein